MCIYNQLNMSKFVYRLSQYVQLQSTITSEGGQMPLISCSLWISIYLWSSLKIKFDLIKKTQIYVHNPIV